MYRDFIREPWGHESSVPGDEAPYSFVVKVKNGLYLLNLINASDITAQNVISEIYCFWLSTTSCLIELRGLLFIINMKTD